MAQMPGRGVAVLGAMRVRHLHRDRRRQPNSRHQHQMDEHVDEGGGGQFHRAHPANHQRVCQSQQHLPQLTRHDGQSQFEGMTVFAEQGLHTFGDGVQGSRAARKPGVDWKRKPAGLR